MFRKLIKLFSQKAWITVLSLLVQIALVVVGVLYLSAQFWWMWIVLEGVSFFICVYIVSRDINPSYKLSWCMLILMFPAFGGLMYLFIGRQHTPRRVRKRLKKASDATQVLLNMTNAEFVKTRSAVNPTEFSCADLVLNSASYPIYGNTETRYYPLGDEFFPALVADIRAAKKFVFMEYFIIDSGEVWSEIEEALMDRAENGVDVRLIYDDVGSMFTLPKKSIKRLIGKGVKVCPFNKITLSFDMRLNNRSHRKITVIDGEIAYSGGNNIADEYANRITRFGHWKDTHMRFTGDAVWSFTIMFLSFWHTLSTEPIAYNNYKHLLPSPTGTNPKGYVQPLASGPDKHENLIERAFLNLISTAKKYVYITSPYLILDNEMQTALVNAAKAGVDVRIIIPGTPDKKMVYLTTKSFVPLLIKSGVKVYTYTPGFIHAKMIIVDDDHAYIGSSNMDYRSFYLHYECGALLYNTDTIPEMKADFLATQGVSKELTHDSCKVNPLARPLYAILRLLAPMM